jgi:Ca2+-transporting ATPase
MLELPPGIAGLSNEEASSRLKSVGPNRLVPERRGEKLRQLLGLLSDPMALMLAAASAVYLALGETRDGVILLVALVPVLGVDVFLEARSREALRKLALAVAPRARVVRDGVEREIPTEELAPGDLLVIREGDVLHADGAVCWSANLAADESPLTGESEPQDKPSGAPFLAGSLIVAGHGFGEIQKTGAATEFGRIAGLVAGAESEPTPLQRKTRQIVRGLAGVAVLVSAGVFALEVSRGMAASKAFLSAVSLTMAAMPEEFPLVFTLFLSLGAWRLTRHRVLVRRLASVETLGSTTVICTDKTGTLTSGTFGLEEYRILSPGLSPAEFLEAAVLACEINPADPMERAIAAAAQEGGVDPTSLHERWRLVADYDFDPHGKHMSHVWEEAAASSGRRRIVAKGALEGVLEHCDAAPEEVAAVESVHADLARQGIRLLAVAGRLEGGAKALSGPREDDERGLRLYGLLGFRDPIRTEVPAAIAECKTAGIHVKLITGDHALTALAIAQDAGISAGVGEAVTGEQLHEAAPAQFSDLVERADVLARIRPEQKYAIVDALVGRGEIVAMAGDGINDAPALRRASIGVAMGLRGTEVARAAADMVLLDDNLASVVEAVREGRHIFDNIQRAFLYLLAFHVPIVGLALSVPLAGLPLLLLPVHLVWLELIVHPVSALIFEGEPASPDLMRRPPRDPRRPLLPWTLILPSVLSGVLLTLACLLLYAWRQPAGEVPARSQALAVLVLGSLLLVWSERAKDGPWNRMPFPRGARFWIVYLPVAASLPIFMEIPAFASALRVAPLRLRDWGLCLLLASSSVVWRVFGTRWLSRANPTAR